MKDIVDIDADKYLNLTESLQLFTNGIISRRPEIPRNGMKTMEPPHLGKYSAELVEKGIGQVVGKEFRISHN